MVQALQPPVQFSLHRWWQMTEQPVCQALLISQICLVQRVRMTKLIRVHAIEPPQSRLQHRFSYADQAEECAICLGSFVYISYASNFSPLFYHTIWPYIVQTLLGMKRQFCTWHSRPDFFPHTQILLHTKSHSQLCALSHMKCTSVSSVCDWFKHAASSELYDYKAMMLHSSPTCEGAYQLWQRY